MSISLATIQSDLQQFAYDRQWDTYHNPKNIVMALQVEASELAEIFLWLNDQESFELSTDKYEHARQEVADVFLYLLTFCRHLDIDIVQSAAHKIGLIAHKYPSKSTNPLALEQIKKRLSLEPLSLEVLAHVWCDFALDRLWEQSSRYSPKNIAIYVSIEVSELLEIFQWLTLAESEQLDARQYEKVKQECGDIMLNLITLCRHLDIDLLQAAADKLKLNAIKYPVDKALGNAKKHTEL